MEESVTDALRRLVSSSKSPEEFNQRVIQSFGQGMLGAARQIAAEMKGFDWLREGRVVQKPSLPSDLRENANAHRASVYALRIVQVPTNFVLLVGSLALLAVLLFPPFVVHLPEGVLSNVGFTFLFSPPQIGRLVAVVNVPLLAVEVAIICAITASVLWRVRSIRDCNVDAGSNRE